MADRIINLEVELEELIDTYNVETVLDAIAGICGEKADHIRASYDDRALARVWSDAGTRISRLASKLTV